MSPLTIVITILIVLVILDMLLTKKKPANKRQQKDNNNWQPDNKRKLNNNNEQPKGSNWQQELTTIPMEYPYQKKYLLTKAEYAFYKILRVKCDEKGILICPKVRLEDFINVTSTENKQKYRGYIKSRHIDFLLCDNNLNVKFAIELDDNTHKQQSIKKTDEFKDNLFRVIGIPLHRINMTNGFYESAIENILKNVF